MSRTEHARHTASRTPLNEGTMQKLIIVALLLGLSGCASGSGTRALPRPSGPVAPCPAYANYETARAPDGRGLLQVLDSLARTPEAQGRSGRDVDDEQQKRARKLIIESHSGELPAW